MLNQIFLAIPCNCATRILSVFLYLMIRCLSCKRHAWWGNIEVTSCIYCKASILKSCNVLSLLKNLHTFISFLFWMSIPGYLLLVLNDKGACWSDLPYFEYSPSVYLVLELLCSCLNYPSKSLINLEWIRTLLRFQ